MEHKLPWTTSKQPGGRFWVIYSVDGSVIATDLYKWRAQQIVTACNEHPRLKRDNKAMLKALELINQCAQCVHEISTNKGHCPGHADGELPCAGFQECDKASNIIADKAIALATGE